jgi:hypothetical protein
MKTIKLIIALTIISIAITGCYTGPRYGCTRSKHITRVPNNAW